MKKKNNNQLIEERKRRLKLFEEMDWNNYVLPHFDSNCEICIHYLRRDKKCIAWKDGAIPEEVWNGNHNEVLEGQISPFVFKTIGSISLLSGKKKG